MPFDRRAKFALIVACITLLVCGVGFQFAVDALKVYLRKEPVELRETFATLSRTVGDWTAYGEDEQFDKALLEELGTTNTIGRNYALNGNPRDGLLNVHIAYYTGMIDAVPHVPDRCFVASGMEPVTLSDVFPLTVDTTSWRQDSGPVNVATGQRYNLAQHRDAFTNRLESVPMPVGDLKIRMTEFLRKDKPEIKWFGGYFFIANGRTTANPRDIRMLAFMPSERYAYYCKVQIVFASANATSDDYLRLTSDFLSSFLPDLMMRLPDWRQVEAASQQPNTAQHGTPSANAQSPNASVAALPVAASPSASPSAPSSTPSTGEPKTANALN